MERYKEEFIDFLLQNKALKIGEDFSLKSKRLSPYFINIGDFNDGVSTAKLGEAYAGAIKDLGKKFDLLYGIPEKAKAPSIATSTELARLGINKHWFFIRGVPKEYGEMTNITGEEKKKMFVGRYPEDGSKILLLDDVLTTGDTKNENIGFLNKLINNPSYPALVIAVDRQEVGTSGRTAIEEFTEKTGIPVFSIINTSEIYQYLKTKVELNQKDVERIANYLRVYGTPEARANLGKLEQIIIEKDRSVLPACDVSTIEEFEELVKQTADVDGIGGYKVGFELALSSQFLSLKEFKDLLEVTKKYLSAIANPEISRLFNELCMFSYKLPDEVLIGGLEHVVKTARKYTDKPIIYDHQKAGTDIPDTGKNFARVCKKAGVDAVILFPQSGPETERAWIYHALDNGLKVIAGGPMTHSGYKESEGGFISDEGVFRMIRIAAKAGINNFVAPGTKLEDFKRVVEIVKEEGVQNPIYYAPGFVAQGGKIEDATKIAGDKWHAIVGRGIYKETDMRKAAIEHTSQL